MRLNGNKNKIPTKNFGFKGKKATLRNLILESPEKKLSTYDLYEKYNNKHPKRGVTMQELANILSRNKFIFVKLDETIMPHRGCKLRSGRKICMWGSVDE